MTLISLAEECKSYSFRGAATILMKPPTLLGLGLVQFRMTSIIRSQVCIPFSESSPVEPRILLPYISKICWSVASNTAAFLLLDELIKYDRIPTKYILAKLADFNANIVHSKIFDQPYIDGDFFIIPIRIQNVLDVPLKPIRIPLAENGLSVLLLESCLRSELDVLLQSGIYYNGEAVWPFPNL